MSETIKILNHTFICNRCGCKWLESKWISNCPKHGEFCANCAVAYTKYQHYIICPDCKVDNLENIRISNPHIIIKSFFEGIDRVWIGSTSA